MMLLPLAGLALLAVVLPLGTVLASGWVMFDMHADAKTGRSHRVHSDHDADRLIEDTGPGINPEDTKPRVRPLPACGQVTFDRR
jgi:hypothetical protein